MDEQGQTGKHDHNDAGWNLNSSMIWGGFIVVVGLWWLLGELGVVPFNWSWAGPVALIAVGLSMVLRQRGRHANCC